MKSKKKTNQKTKANEEKAYKYSSAVFNSTRKESDFCGISFSF